ncbi:MAG: hypothetical protein A2919_00135 [Candidatus Spechtbacteria bacterium RIFCSPLOWO2_01_FULL_43_12]|uniref:Uncharacterized protein n=1 Tax=Candidatus Spechtbacteria bacterium RIFCSPLOWO2_01_FULL_43_12 TaxID=1802162 RepID=A0A1G2HEL0_9BACT|nr:MAG: hypothetical protein A2919_00135 [Candidatus Spechtbacteria bacterium RIFCSPLOWO2_01_FULL_43_12]
MSNEEIVNLIQAKYPQLYPNEKIDILTSSLEKMSPVVKKALESFLSSGNNLELNLLGYSVEKLTKEHGMNEIAAYLTLDWIVREPEKAIESLKKGHDFVRFSNS